VTGVPNVTLTYKQGQYMKKLQPGHHNLYSLSLNAAFHCE